MNSTLGMIGRWSWSEGRHGGLILDVSSTLISLLEFPVCHLDKSLFGSFRGMNKSQVDTKIDSMDPDLLSQKVNRETFITIARGTRIQHMQICCSLPGRKGRYVESGALRIRPDRTLGGLSDTVILYSNGFTIEDYASPEGRIGPYRHRVDF